MSGFQNTHQGPLLDADEAKLQQLDNLIRQGEEAERQEAARKAEEARRQAEREAAGPGHSLDDLKRMRADLAAQVAQRQHHLQTEAQRDVLRRRAERLAADVEMYETNLANKRNVLAAVQSKLE